MTVKGLFGLVAVGVLAVGVGGPVLFGNYEYSSGERAGTVDKLSYKGFGCKTWEGQLAMNNMVTGPDGRLTNSFAFSVKSPEIVKQLQEAQQSGDKVKIKYSETMFHWPCEQDTDYEIVGVETVDNQQNKSTAPMPMP